jgi:ribosomal protein S18 acetylase RimI-like enzyme
VVSATRGGPTIRGVTTVRPEEPADAEAVERVRVRGWQRGYAGMLPDEILNSLDVTAGADRRRRALEAAENPFTSLVAEHDGEIVGFVTFGPYRVKQSDQVDPAFGEILAIYVDPDHWGRGAGTTLLHAALDELPQSEVRLWVLEKNVAAQAFYRKHGLTPDGVSAPFRPRGSDLEFPELRFVIVRGGRGEEHG